MVTAGHAGDVAGWFADAERSALDGALAPLRNVHKFDPVIRVPLVLGLAHLLGVLGGPSPRGAATGAGRARSDTIGDRLAYAGVLLVSDRLGRRASPARRSRAGSGRPTTSRRCRTTGTQPRTGSTSNADDTTALLRAGLELRLLPVGRPRRRADAAARVVAVGGAQRRAARAGRQHPDARRHRGAAGVGSCRPTDWPAYLRRAGIGSPRGPQRPARLPTRPRRCSCTRCSTARRGSTGWPTSGRRWAARPGSAADGTRRWSTTAGPRDYPAVEIYAVDGAQRAVAATGEPAGRRRAREPARAARHRVDRRRADGAGRRRRRRTSTAAT